jgi:long-chain fatty acid transport protein
MFRNHWCHCLCVTAAILSIPNAAQAGLQDLFGFGARGPALSGNAVAFAGGFESVYYNPAGLTVGAGQSFNLGFQAGFFDLTIHSPRSDELASLEEIEPVSGLNLGFDVRIPLKGVLKNKIALGVGFYVPTKVLFSARIPKPFEPQLWVAGANARSVSFQAGLGVVASDWLRLGLGVRVLAGLDGKIDVAPGQLGNLSSEVEDEMVAVYGAVVGAMIQAADNWSIGLVWRDELGSPYKIPVTADLGEQLQLPIPPILIAGRANFDPMQAAVAVGWQASSQLRLEVGLLWKFWRRFPLPIQNGTAAIPAQDDPDFQDTFIPRAGIEREFNLGSSTLAVRGGYAFESTPVPKQDGDHNFLDGDRHIVSVGCGWTVDLGEGAQLELNVYAQLHIMQKRSTAKENNAANISISTNNQGFPWIGSEGHLFSSGFSMGMSF